MSVIRRDHLVQSVADALQFISYYHPADYIRALSRAYEREQSAAAKDAIAQILTNSRLCAEGHRPICQDTGIVNVFLRIGMEVRFDFKTSLEDVVNEGVRRAYMDPDNKLRASILADPVGSRRNTGDNTPAVIHMQLVPGDKLEVDVAAKGGGSEAKSRFAMLNPSDSIADWVLKTVPTMGAGWCPPGMLGIGVGGTAEKAMLMAKESLMKHIDMTQLKARGPNNQIEELRIDPREVQAYVDGESAELTPTEFRLLYQLALDQGRVSTRDELLQKLWGRRESHRDRTVDVFVRRLREKIDRRASRHTFIQTRYGVGYKLEPVPKDSG